MFAASYLQLLLNRRVLFERRLRGTVFYFVRGHCAEKEISLFRGFTKDC
jgi:hypothetical protein